MTNKVAASFGVIMAIFIVLALVFWSFSALKHARHPTQTHNRLHQLRLNDWIATRNATPDIEMAALPARPENTYVRNSRVKVSGGQALDSVDLSRASVGYAAGFGGRVQVCREPLRAIPDVPRSESRPGFF